MNNENGRPPVPPEVIAMWVAPFAVGFAAALLALVTEYSFFQKKEPEAPPPPQPEILICSFEVENAVVEKVEINCSSPILNPPTTPVYKPAEKLDLSDVLREELLPPIHSFDWQGDYTVGGLIRHDMDPAVAGPWFLQSDVPTSVPLSNGLSAPEASSELSSDSLKGEHLALRYKHESVSRSKQPPKSPAMTGNFPVGEQPGFSPSLQAPVGWKFSSKGTDPFLPPHSSHSPFDGGSGGSFPLVPKEPASVPEKQTTLAFLVVPTYLLWRRGKKSKSFRR